MNSLYLHIPFCLSKCFYCSFSSYPGLEELQANYCAALCLDITRSYPDRHGIPLDSLFFGGGTPTVLSLEQLVAITHTCRAVYGFSAQAEISIEANPGTVDYTGLQRLKEVGFNRLSLGMQSCHDDELAVLGRRHNGAQCRAVFRDARRAGFTNISLDLMYGLPNQTPDRWRSSLEQALALEPEHLSLYQLSIEEGTRFFSLFQRDQLSMPGEEEVLAMDTITRDLCRSSGYDHYEISNFCQPGFACRHNIVYWHNEEYLACGAGAVSYVKGRRSRRISDPACYTQQVEQGKSPLAESERLTRHASFRETVMMGLRLFAGVDEKRLLSRYGLSFAEVYGDSLLKPIEDGLVERRGSVLLLTDKGRAFANVVMAQLI